MQKAIKYMVLAALLFASAVFPVSAQKLVTGAKAPDLKIGEYLTEEPEGGKPMLIEFFYSPSKPCMDRLPVLNALAKANAKRLDVLLLAREDKDKIESLVVDQGYVFAVALDDQSKTFTAYGVQYVPYGVLLDAKGRVIWFGNSTRFTQQTLDTALGR